MKNITLAFCLASALLAASASAYEVDTHAEISDQALARSTLSSRIQDLGANMGLLSVDDLLSDGNNYFLGLLGFQRRMSVVGWVRMGSVEEDDLRTLRVRNHFYNPTAPPGEEGYRYRGLRGLPSTVWALEPTVNPNQDYSYRDVKEHLYQSVVATTERERKRNLALMFRSVGQVIHLIQDLAQPQHTRNDSHALGSSYEEFTNLAPLALPLGGYPIVNLNAPESYWVNPGGSGLANYTNRGFVTAGTNFIGTRVLDTLIVLPNPGFALPNGNGATVEVRQITDPDLLGPNGPGQPLTGEVWFVRVPVTDSYQGVTELNPRASTFSIFDDDLARTARNLTFSVNRFTYQSAQNLLIPRAVGYSAGMINHIFRGKLEISPPQFGTYAVADHATAQGFQQLRATVTNTTEGEAMSGGTLKVVAKYHRNRCYSPDLSGEFRADSNGNPIPPCPNYRSGEEFISTATMPTLNLASGQQIEINLTLQPPIPMDATDLYLQAVYRGPLGTEQDGVAVGMKDIAEPTFLAIFNATDVFELPSANGGQFHYHRDITANVTDPRYSIVDSNRNGRYDSPPDTNVVGGNARFDLRVRSATVSTASSVPEGRFFRTALLLDAAPFQFSISAVGAGFNQTDNYQFDAVRNQLFHPSGTYYVTSVFDIRATRQSRAVVYYRSLQTQSANLSSMQPSTDPNGARPLPAQIVQ